VVKVVLNADVLIGALDGLDPHHAAARTLLGSWQRQDVTRLVSVVNLTEVLVGPAGDRRAMRAAREAIAALGVQVQQAGEAVAVEAARLRSAYPFSVPDAFCLATAHSSDAQVASFDEKVLRTAGLERIPVIRRRSRARRQGRP
jgi:predicted nucleic acid-binding protein